MLRSALSGGRGSKTGVILSTLSSDTVCCISIAGSDKLRLVGGPETLRGAVERAMAGSKIGFNESSECWRIGFQWKLHGSPWLGVGVFAVTARYLFAQIIAEFYAEGYTPFITADANRQHEERETLFFRERTCNLHVDHVTEAFDGPDDAAVIPAASLRLPPRFWCLVLCKHDKIRTIGATGRDVALVREGILQFKTIQKERMVLSTSDRCHQFKLKGKPWSSRSIKSAVKSRLVLLGIFETLMAAGSCAIATINPTNSPGSPGDCFIIMSQPAEEDDAPIRKHLKYEGVIGMKQ